MENSDSSAMIFREKEKQEIMKLLAGESVKKIVLEGDAGVGKSWIAEQIGDLAVSKGLIHMVCWVFLNQQDESKSSHHVSLGESIVRQMSVLATEERDNEERKDDEEGKDDAERKEDEEELEEKRSKSLRRKIAAKLKAMGSAGSDGKKFLLLILDGLPGTMDEDDLMSKINKLLERNEGTAYKVLITRRKERVEDGKKKGVTEIASEEVIEVKKLDPDSSLDLLKEKVAEKVKKNICFEKCAGKIAEKSEGLPAAIVMIAEALNRFRKQDSRTLTLEDALEEAAAREKGPEGENPILLCVYDMLLRSDMALINCWSYSFYFFQRHGGVHSDELIACWIAEGCVGNIDGVEKAYKKGHRVLMELIYRRILKIQDDEVVMEALALGVPHYRGAGNEGTWNLGLFEVGDWPLFGRITEADGMIKTLHYQTRRKHSDSDRIIQVKGLARTLLIDGSRLHREVSNEFFKPWKELRVLVLFSPTFTSLPPTFSEMRNLRLLVLRCCDLLVGNTDCISELDLLEVLEISGATSLKNMKNEFFEKLIRLRSLNLSRTQIEVVPSSISKLVELRWLILRGCSRLNMLPTLSNLENLEVLDLSGASEFRIFEDLALIPLEKLRILDVSHTKLDRLPILGSLQNLTRLSGRCCESLPRSSKLGALSNLQILDLSGSISLEEIPNESKCTKERLKILDLSNTTIGLLPFNFSSLSMLQSLNLSNTEITSLPSLSKLRNLEVLNLSCCSHLEELGAGSLEHMTHLRSLNLSETKIKNLVSLSNLVNLRELLLENCGRLGEQSLESLSKLEELHLRGVTFPQGTEAEFLRGTTGIRLLDLSETRLKLPKTCKLPNLTKLSLRGCFHSEAEPILGAGSKLEILDLSATGIVSLPSLENLSSLRELKLRGCSKLAQLPALQSLTQLEVLDLWGTQVEEFLEYFPNLTCLKRLDLPCIDDIKDFEWGKIKRVPEELNWSESSLFKHSEKRPCMLLSHSELSQILVRFPELEDPCFQNFHFFVCASKGQRRAGDIYLHRVDPSVREVYFKTYRIPHEHRFLEIVGFDRPPTDVEGAFIKAEYFSFIDNKFIRSLSDVTAGTCREKGLAMKVCILEMCSEMATIFGTEETRDAEARTTADEEEETGDIMVKNLETLWASHLLKLNSVFSCNAQTGSFEYLRELYLECCPRLVVVFDSPEFPENLEILQIKFCRSLKTLFSGIRVEEGKFSKLQKLQLLELPELTSIAMEHSQSVLDIFPSVRELYLDRCPVLESVFASSQSRLNLEILEIRSRKNLKTLLPPSTAGFPKLQKLHLLELHELTSIGVGDSRGIVDIFPSIRELYLDCCPVLEAVFAPSQPLENLEILKIRFCDNLRTVSSSHTAVFPTLQKLHLVELPELTSIGDIFPSVIEFYLERCPTLEAVFASSQSLEKLEILEIRFCNNLKNLFPQIITESPKLRKLHLVELPQVTGIGVPEERNLQDVFPSMRSIKVRTCPKFKDLERLRQLPNALVEGF